MKRLRKQTIEVLRDLYTQLQRPKNKQGSGVTGNLVHFYATT